MFTEYFGSVSYALLVVLVAAVILLVWRLALQRDAKTSESRTARRKLHDVRNTLSTFINYAEEIEDLSRKTGQPHLGEMAKAIRLQAFYTSDISRFEAKKPVTFDLADLLRFLCSFYSSTSEEGVKVAFGGAGRSCYMTGDIVSVFRIFENLLVNAKREAGRAGGGVAVEMDGGEVRVSNRFLGPPPGDEIYRDGVTSKKEAESGQGLASVLECAGAIGASVSHEVEGDTVTFKVKIPGLTPGVYPGDAVP
jgi:signal transduction histidine kinase